MKSITTKQFMLMISKALFSLLLMIISVNITFANSEIEIFSVTGEVYIYDDSNEWRKLNSNDHLNEEDKIKLSNDSKIVFLTGDKIYKVSDSGIFKLEKIIKKYSDSSLSFAASYFKYVLSELAHHHPDVGDNPEDYMETKGTVYRGLSTKNFPPDSTVIISDNVKFNWSGNAKEEQTFLIGDGNRDVLFKITIKDTSLMIDLQKSNSLNNSGVYFWKAFSIDNHEPPSTLIILDNNEERKLQEEIGLQRQNIDEDDIFDLLKLGVFYESKNLFIEAKSVYQKVLEFKLK